VDGDTLRVKWQGLAWYVRIVGLDTDELNGPKHKRAVEQKGELDRFLKRWIFRPRLIAETAKSRKGWQYIRHHNGRWLCRLYVWSWSRFWWMDYAEYMVKTGQVKKGSRWNGKYTQQSGRDKKSD